MACSTSMGVRIELKTGGVTTGYIQWNGAEYDDFFSPNISSSPAYAELNNYISSQKWHSADRYNLIADEVFERWAVMVNLCVEHGLAVPSNGRQAYAVYPDLRKIKFPSERYLAVKGGERKVSVPEIKSVKKVPELSIRTDTTGLDAVYPDEIEKLNSEPKYKVENEYSTGSDVYMVYSDSAPLVELFGSLLDLFPEKLSLNGTTIASMEFGKYVAECPDSLEGSAALCEEFKEQWSKYSEEVTQQEAPCYRELDEVTNKFRNTSGKQVKDVPEVKAKTEECGNIQKVLRGKYGFLPFSAEKLRQSGIVHFSYSRD